MVLLRVRVVALDLALRVPAGWLAVVRERWALEVEERALEGRVVLRVEAAVEEAGVEEEVEVAVRAVMTGSRIHETNGCGGLGFDVWINGTLILM